MPKDHWGAMRLTLCTGMLDQIMEIPSLMKSTGQTLKHRQAHISVIETRSTSRASAREQKPGPMLKNAHVAQSTMPRRAKNRLLSTSENVELKFKGKSEPRAFLTTATIPDLYSATAFTSVCVTFILKRHWRRQHCAT